ncbi:glyceraldehyde-3-phosphate dehydrogenase [Schumannella soli]|uniref:Glyceraldehyde-3-phosphate dehydrogenase n=1 Tax=Schumannella soli TaxID=2590779 RepID=A0A506XXI8_9MICO|nr:glyceraldehyde-3-phosphate dehydrogenase [Schumannella soli]TPW74017.1 glyceraldehyde-3-phosphate dehydrogenase [Schumannella soli]
MQRSTPSARHEALLSWADTQSQAERLIPLLGRLHRERGVVTSLYGRRLINLSAIDVVKAHRFGRHADAFQIPLDKTVELAEALLDAGTRGLSVDLAALLADHREARTAEPELTLAEFLARELPAPSADEIVAQTAGRDVVLYGFGRIGRLVARILINHAGSGGGPRLRAIVVRRGSDDDLVKRASLLRRDSIHGPFEGTISVDHDAETILANGTLIQVIYADDPREVDYSAHGISDAILIDNTGRWRDEAGLRQHLERPGIARVLLTAPGKGDLPNIVHGVNSDSIGDAQIVSAASCTTNAVTPVLKVLDDALGVERGHIETIHSFTNDQNLIDNFHKADRRGRAAGLNMVITETGAARAVAKALPKFEGKLTGNAIRVPTPDVSIAILNLELSRAVTAAEVNDLIRVTSVRSPLRRQVGYVESPDAVSTDFLGARQTGIVDGLATVADGRHVVVYVWYDNEFGYSHQVVRIAEHLAGARPASGSWRAYPIAAPVVAGSTEPGASSAQRVGDDLVTSDV